MTRDARAFWLRSPGEGEIRTAALRSPARTRCSSARCTRESAGVRDPCLPGRRTGQPAQPDARAVPDGDFRRR